MKNAATIMKTKTTGGAGGALIYGISFKESKVS